MALILRNGGSQNPDRWLKEPRNNQWGFTHIEISNNDICLDIGCGGGANVKKLLAKTPYGKVTGIDYSDISVIKSPKINQAEIENKRCEIL